MQLNVSMNQRQELQMKLSQRMIQAMKILQMPIQNLQERIEQELLENPVLELTEKTADAEPVEALEPVEAEAPAPDEVLVLDGDAGDFSKLEALNRDWDDHFNEEHRPSRNGIDEEGDRKHDAMQNMPSRPPDLRDHLIEQITFLDVDPEQDELLRYVISHLDSNGYLVSHSEDGEATPIPLEDLLANYPHPVSAAEMEGALMMVQRLDPSGVGARDLKECLLLQLAPDTPHRDVARALIMDHLEDIRHNRLPVIQKQTGFPIEAIAEAIETIRHLNPKPGAAFNAEAARNVVPDVIVTKTEAGDYDVRLTDDWLPAVHIPKSYYELYRNKGEDPKTRDYLRKKLSAAEWLLDAVRQRRNTLEKVARAIIRHQKAFLDLGPDHIEPLKMQQIADQVGVHVTTVSRAVDDKYVQTPRGLFPLKRFFGGGTKTQTGEDVAWERIKNKLLELIGQEDKANPLSDDDLVKKLQESGYPVARRTVTKYRKTLDIPSSRERKDWTKA